MRSALATTTLVLALSVTSAHSPQLDGHLDDWCLATAPAWPDASARLVCSLGEEEVWWDARADSGFNDLLHAATTQDVDRLYLAYQLQLELDPSLLPFVQIALDTSPGGHDRWWDPLGALASPGHCSVDTSRLCTTDDDCHFCAITTRYTGTPDERPNVCGSTGPLDTCNPDLPEDLCIRTQSCLGIGTGPAPSFAGSAASPAVEPDYLLIYDFSRWLAGFCDHVKLLRHDDGAWVEVPRDVADPWCPLPTWHFSLQVGPGTNPPLAAEIGIPWEAFDCIDCPAFGPGDAFRWTMQISRGLFTFDYQPRGALEDAMSEAVAGRWTTSSTSCPQSGEASTECEIADGSLDAFVPLTAIGPGGAVEGLTLDKTFGLGNELMLNWDRSCSAADGDYAIYEGIVGDWYSHVEPTTGSRCSTGGARQASVESGPGDRYYLIVPSNALTEGAYGSDGAGVGRPASATPCLPQSVGLCPPH